MNVLEFVPAGEVDAVFFESSYYLAPERGGERASTLCYQALRKTGLMAVTKISMHSREHMAVLRVGARHCAADALPTTTKFTPLKSSVQTRTW